MKKIREVNSAEHPVELATVCEEAYGSIVAIGAPAGGFEHEN
jgi:hypothetical protein